MTLICLWKCSICQKLWFFFSYQCIGLSILALTLTGISILLIILVYRYIYFGPRRFLNFFYNSSVQNFQIGLTSKTYKFWFHKINSMIKFCYNKDSKNSVAIFSKMLVQELLVKNSIPS